MMKLCAVLCALCYMKLKYVVPVDHIDISVRTCTQSSIQRLGHSRSVWYAVCALWPQWNGEYGRSEHTQSSRTTVICLSNVCPFLTVPQV